jgi:hypothetical protein
MLTEKKRYPEVLILMTLLSSCATVLNKPVQKVFIATDKNVTVTSVERAVLVDSSLSSADIYYVPRSNKPLIVHIKAGSNATSVKLKPTHSFAYWFNIIENYGIGMLVDKDNVKRYGYPARSYLSLEGDSIKISRFAPIEKGSINLSLSPTLMNSFDIKATNKQYYSGGVFGMEAGVEYFYQRNKYLSFNTGAATTVFGEYIGTGYYETGNVLFASVRNNFIAGRFDFGYGVNLSQLTWQKRYNDTAKVDEVTKNTGAGFSLSSQYRIGHYFRIGALYQPVLFKIKNGPVISYQHFLTLHLIWKLPLHTSSQAR